MAEINSITWCAKLPLTIECIREEALIGMTHYPPATLPQNITLAVLVPKRYMVRKKAIIEKIRAGVCGVVYMPGCPVQIHYTKTVIPNWELPMVVINIYRQTEVENE